MIPEEFQHRMQQMLGEEYQDFIRCMEQEPDRALRINTLKKREKSDRAAQDLPFLLTPVPWTDCGYYYDASCRPGKHVLHEAGVYYIQEASAMAPVVYLEARPGEKVLDLCAAPGGKSTQMAAAMQNEGILVCNEVYPARAKILSENIERMGIVNALVTNETPERLAERFLGYFDRVLVDAPCSGEGMFRKNEEAGKEWSQQNVALCAERQDAILDCAAGMLRPGGRMVYSTCTFAPQENEGSVSRFLKRHPEFAIIEAKKMSGMSSGVPKWGEEKTKGLEDTIRLWPHKLRGEGHFIAVLQKEGEWTGEVASKKLSVHTPDLEKNDCEAFVEFAQTYLKAELFGKLLRYGEQLYLVPEQAPDIQKLKVLRPGLHLGTLKKNRFEPAHALALALSAQETAYSRELSMEEAAAWVRGEALRTEDGEKGWYLMSVEGYSIGWGKLAGGMLKNHYPKGLRHS